MQLTDVFPSIPQVKRLVTMAPNVPNMDLDFWIWLRTFQGIVNRDEPHIYMAGGESTQHWLDYYVKTFGIPVSEQNDLDVMFDQYKHLINGYVVYDVENVIQTQNLALTMAGIDDVLPIAADQEEWMTRHGIPKRDDLRGRFADDWDAAEWAIDNLWPNCYKKIYANFCIHRPVWYAMGHGLADFIVRNRGMSLDLPRCRTHRRSLGLYHRMMDDSDGPGVQMAWHCAWEQEKEYVINAARHGYYVLCSTGTPNMTIHGGVGDPDKSYVQPLPDKADCKADKDKTYVCFYNSDGDATWAMHNLHSDNWLAPERGAYKFGWGFLPLTVRLMPAMLQYYHETKTENDCFWGPSSGAAYTYTHAWPKDMVDMYLSETRQLLDQSGQNGCNMVNWYLQDWWREVEDDEAVLREQEALKSGPGLVCGLGGSPFAKSYPRGPIPKLHSVHIANVGRENIGDIVKFADECPTRPAFMFLFAQISEGIWGQLESEMPLLKDHPEIEILSMDEFFLTLQDAVDNGMIGDELYEPTPELRETWLGAPGRHRLPLAERLTDELSEIAHSETDERRRQIADSAWTQLVSGEIEGVAGNQESFLSYFKGRAPATDEEEPDVMFYVAFTVAWLVVRSAIEAQGIYANHRVQCLDDFRRTCDGIVDVAPFENFSAAWETWDDGAPSLDDTTAWIDGVAAETKKLRAALGPKDGEAFTNWPPKTI